VKPTKFEPVQSAPGWNPRWKLEDGLKRTIAFLENSLTRLDQTERLRGQIKRLQSGRSSRELRPERYSTHLAETTFDEIGAAQLSG
jgi:hypothetical protein